ncbi:DUF3426 domain-containing protein [Lysobacter claricitrinus]|uniref:DUF3426 domain-containing protein n=1 Tax=Lysobacter claricitrinus TaxID=3367728 RepID=UPI0037DA8C6A
MFKPCPTCGFLVALIAGREASQRCPRCGGALVAENEPLEAADDQPQRRRMDAARGEPARDTASMDAPTPNSDGDTRDVAINALPVHGAQSTRTPPSDVVDESPIVDVEDARHIDDDVAPAPLDAAVDERRATHDGPSFVRRRTTHPTGRRWPIFAAICTLALLFAVQLVLAQRTELAADARWRPLVLNACGVLGCNVPAWREPQAYRMVTRNVRPNPRKPGVLHVTATVRNDARWAQPAPVIVLSLSDLDGRLVGARQVTPRDYGQRVVSLVAPGDSLDVAFDVREPGARVESYDFQLQ